MVFGLGPESFFCAGGVSVYIGLRVGLNARNPGKRKKLSRKVKAIMSPFFGDIDLDSVRLRMDAKLWPVSSDMAAICLGYTIFFRQKSFNECCFDDLYLLMHELVHVSQVEELGALKAACEYGKAWSQYGYDAMPPEVDADNFRENRYTALKDKWREVCESEIKEAEKKLGRRKGWFWLVWGGA